MSPRDVGLKITKYTGAVLAALVAFSLVSTERLEKESLFERIFRGLGIDMQVAVILVASLGIFVFYMLCMAWPNFAVEAKPDKSPERGPDAPPSR